METGEAITAQQWKVEIKCGGETQQRNGNFHAPHEEERGELSSVNGDKLSHNSVRYTAGKVDGSPVELYYLLFFRLHYDDKTSRSKMEEKKTQWYLKLLSHLL